MHDKFGGRSDVVAPASAGKNPERHVRWLAAAALLLEQLSSAQQRPL